MCIYLHMMMYTYIYTYMMYTYIYTYVDMYVCIYISIHQKKTLNIKRKPSKNNKYKNLTLVKLLDLN